MKFNISKEWCEQRAKYEDGGEIGAGLAQHPLTIPGELLAEACELGRIVVQQVEGVWCAAILLAGYNAVEYASTPAEALQTAIAKARELDK